MLHGHAHGVEEHENDDEPVELLRLHRLSYPVPESSLGQPELLAGPFFFRRRGPREACNVARIERLSNSRRPDFSRVTNTFSTNFLIAANENSFHDSRRNATHRRPGRRRLPLPPCPCFYSCRASSFSPRLFFFLQRSTISALFLPALLHSLRIYMKFKTIPGTNLLICASSPLPWSFLQRVLPPL